MKNVQWILFDLDGTLTDSGAGITNSVKYSLEKFGITNVDKETLYRFIGPPLVDSYEGIFGFPHEKAQTAVEYYREYYRETGIFENAVYDGITDTLKKLIEAGKKLVLATAKPEPFAIQIMEHFQLSQYFTEITGATFDGTRLRKEEVIGHALELCGINPSCAIMVGDRDNDVLGAKKFGIDCIGVLYGYGSRKELLSSGAKFLAQTPAELCTLILK